MTTKIKVKIHENTSLLAEVYARLSEHISDNETKEIIALLKINELLLMELKHKESFHNEDDVLNTLEEMNKMLNLIAIEI